MKSCKNCYWYDKCSEHEERCEYYDPIYGADQIAVKEYQTDLKERAEEYRELVEEQQS